MTQDEEPISKEPENLAQGVANVIDAAFGVGAAIARATAQATARGAECEPPPASSTSFSVMIHYSLATVGNLISAVTTAAGGAKNVNLPKTPGKASRGTTLPRVHAGARLRVPLSIENPSDSPMTGLTPYLRKTFYKGVESPNVLPNNAIQFSPTVFTVEPKDFEKLTLTVTIPENAVPGRFDLVLALGPSQPDLPFSFEVLMPSPTDEKNAS